MTRSSFALLALAAVPVAAPWASAATALITSDTYLDSYQDGTMPGDDAHTNYGRFGTIKAVSNIGSGISFPDTQSLVHGLFTLPAQAVADLANGGSSVVVTYYANNNQPNGRTVELHPLTHAFVAGTGGDPSLTRGGPAYTSSTGVAVAGGAYNPTSPNGADWFTYDGVNAWTATGGAAAPGGAYAAAFVNGVPNGNGTAYSFDLTALVNNPATRAAVLTNGLLMKVSNETNYVGNDFVSFRSGDTTSAQKPFVTYAVPEPAALGLLGVATLVLRRRRAA